MQTIDHLIHIDLANDSAVAISPNQRHAVGFECHVAADDAPLFHPGRSEFPSPACRERRLRTMGIVAFLRNTLPAPPKFAICNLQSPTPGPTLTHLDVPPSSLNNSSPN